VVLPARYNNAVYVLLVNTLTLSCTGGDALPGFWQKSFASAGIPDRTTDSGNGRNGRQSFPFPGYGKKTAHVLPHNDVFMLAKDIHIRSQIIRFIKISWMAE
jgi:hypothetical protein